MKILRETPIQETGRLMQLRGLFDLAPEKTSRVEWDVHLELPAEWNVGLIVGARELFAAHLVHGNPSLPALLSRSDIPVYTVLYTTRTQKQFR